MNDLLTLINGPAIPGGAGGVIGAIVGAILGQPDCGSIVKSDAGLECAKALLPVVNTPADMAVFIAVGTVIGAAVGFVASKVKA